MCLGLAPRERGGGLRLSLEPVAFAGHRRNPVDDELRQTELLLHGHRGDAAGEFVEL